MFVDPGAAQRQGTAERPAQIISLGQLAGVDLPQGPRPRQESHVQSSRIGPHPGNPMLQAVGGDGATPGGIHRVTRDNPGIEKPSPLHASGPARGSHADGWMRRAANWVVPEKNPTRVVYGIITVGALMAAESGHHESYADAVGSA